MLQVTVTMKTSNFVCFMFNNENELQAGCGEVLNTPWPGREFSCHDSYGLRAKLNGDSISCATIEDTTLTQAAFAERQLAQARANIAAIQLMQADPKIKMHQQMHGAPVMMGGPFQNMAGRG